MNLETSIQPNFEKIGKIAGEAKSIESENAFMEPGQKLKTPGKRGRPTKEEAAKRASEQKAKASQKSAGPQSGPAPQVPPEIAALSQLPSKELAKPLVRGVSALAVSYVGDPRAQMNPDELEAIAMSLGAVMDKYMPGLMSQYGPEMVLALNLGMYGVRVVAMKKVLEHDRRVAEEVAKSAVTQGMPQGNTPKEVSNEEIQTFVPKEHETKFN